MTPKEIDKLRMKLGWLYLTAHCNQDKIPDEYTELFLECDSGSALLSLFPRSAKESDYTRLSVIQARAEVVLADLSSQGVGIEYCIMPISNVTTIGNNIMIEDYDVSFVLGVSNLKG